MPGFDGTGPWGAGPRTGRGLGPCGGGFGRGFGFGCRRGRNFLGWGRAFTKEEEKQAVESYRKELEEELKAIKEYEQELGEEK